MKVKVLEVDEKRKRIALTMRLTDSAAQVSATGGKGGAPRDRQTDAKRLTQHKEERQPAPSGAMAAAFAKFKG